MTVSKKGKRTIVLEGNRFLWDVTDDDEFFAPPGPGHAVRVFAPDGKFYIRFHLGQADATRSHVSLDARVGEQHLVGRFRCPPFEMDPVTPGGVRTLLQWAHDPGTIWLPVNYLGYSIPSPDAH